MSNPRKLHQHTRLTELLKEHVEVEAKLDALNQRREEIRDLIRMRMLRSMSCVGYRGKARQDDVALELAEHFPHVREILGFVSFKATAAWILEEQK